MCAGVRLAWARTHPALYSQCGCRQIACHHYRDPKASRVGMSIKRENSSGRSSARLRPQTLMGQLLLARWQPPAPATSFRNIRNGLS